MPKLTFENLQRKFLLEINFSFNFHEWPRQNFLVKKYQQTSEQIKGKYQSNDQYHILQTNIINIVWLTVGRITK